MTIPAHVAGRAAGPPGRRRHLRRRPGDGLYDPATGSAFNALLRTSDNAANFFLGVAASYSQTLPAPQYKLRSSATTQAIVDSYAAIGVKYETANQPGLPAGLIDVGQRNVSPRLAFAYNKKFGKRSVVVRCGFGEYRFNLGKRLFNVQER